MSGRAGWCIKRSSERDDEERKKAGVLRYVRFFNDTHDLNVFRLLSVYSMEP
jgi:hypothetical protein